MTVEIISSSIFTKVWYRAGIELATPGSAVRHAFVARHVTDCATWPGNGFVLQMAHFYSKKSILKKSIQNDTKWYLRVSRLMP